MTLKETIAMVEAFHNAFGIENRHKPTAELSKAQQELRYRLMAEENDEYLEAVKNNDLVEIYPDLTIQTWVLLRAPSTNHFAISQQF